MRFREFRVLLEEPGNPGYFTVGDSHAKGVADGAGKPWVNLAIGGKQANDSGVRANVSKITPGSVVVVAAGANDTANSYKSANKDPKRVVPPSTIASRVASLVDIVRAQNPSKIILLVFPNGKARTDGMAQWYNGDYQEQVRSAIKSAVNVDQIIDQSDYPISPDNIHLQWSAYGQIGKAIASKYPLGKGSDKPQAAGQGSKPAEAGKGLTSIEVPSGRTGPEVADIQKLLIALGYPLPKHGVDGVRGSETSAAVSKFQADNNLTVDGDPGPDTVAKMNAILKSKPEVASKLTKSTSADVKGNVYGVKDIEDEDVKKLDPLPGSADSSAARGSAEKYLGRSMSNDEWNYLLRATAAESSYNKEEYAMVMGSMLNRARDYGKNGVIAALMAPNQFQAVTGTSADGHKPSANFVRGPTDKQMRAMLFAAVHILPKVSHQQRNFTAANPAAYGAGTNIGYLHAMNKAGGKQIGGTVFNTALV